MEKSTFTEVFGDSPVVRVWDYLLTEREIDFCLSDLARETKVGRATLYRIWGDLLKKRFVLPTRTIGRSKLYKLNTSNRKVKKLIEIDDFLMMEELKKQYGKKKEVVVEASH